jgi:hypothetical protein
MPVHHRLRFLTFPMRASRLCSLWSDMRPLRFRRVPFGRDVAFDPKCHRKSFGVAGNTLHFSSPIKTVEPSLSKRSTSRDCPFGPISTDRG